MKKHTQSRFDETYYTSTLDNGLKLIVWHKPLFKTTSAIFGTPYGGLDFRQVTSDGKEINDPSGIAHFLEHKMFENENCDVMEEFTKLGANCNAFTSYTETCYTFSTSSSNIKAPLNLLLDFVQTLNITEESVEKEKGIINQELAMYQQMPDSRIYYETFKNIYHEHGLNMDIGGNQDTVNSTTLAQLQECYKRNYHPSKMTLVVVTPFDPEYVYEIVKENQSSKQFEDVLTVHRAPINEPKTVVYDDRSIEMNITEPKVSYSFKLDLDIKDPVERAKMEFALRILLESHFSSLNPDYQIWIDNKIINDYFFFDIDISEDYSLITFIAESSDIYGFKEFINKQLDILKAKSIAINQLNQLKHRYFGQTMRIFNNTEDIASVTIRYLFNGIDIFKTIEAIESIDKDYIDLCFSKLDFINNTLFSILPINE